MPRLKVVEAPQHGVGHGNGAGARALGGRVRQGNSPKKTVGKKAPRPKPAKKRVFLSKDQQALLILRYKELPKQKKGSKARGNALTALCKEFDVSEAYPRQLIAALKQNELLPVRDGVGGAPEKIEEHEVDFITRTLEEHAYDLTYRQLSTLTGIPATSLWRFVKETAGWREVNKGTRPRLSDANTYGRYFWAEDALDDDFDLQVDVDEKIFYAWSAAGTLKLPPGVEKPKTRLQSKRYIPKVMMLTGVGRPSEEHDWDGKLGIWPVGHVRGALRGDKRTGLKKGDPVFEAESLDGEKWVQMVCDDIIPAIRAKLRNAKVVRLQFDNAPGHRTGNVDARIVAACKAPRRGGPRIELREQIAQSPCTNLCDLGFFRSIDSRLPKLKSFNLPEFIEQIEEAYNEYPSEKLTALADMKMRVVQCIYNAAGDNDFKLPHRQK